MLVRIKLVLVQSLGVIRMVMSVKPLPHKLSTASSSRMATITINGIAGGRIRPARLSLLDAAIVTLKLTLVLTCGDSDVTTSVDDVIAQSPYHVLQQQFEFFVGFLLGVFTIKNPVGFLGVFTQISES